MVIGIPQSIVLENTPELYAWLTCIVFLFHSMRTFNLALT